MGYVNILIHPSPPDFNLKSMSLLYSAYLKNRSKNEVVPEGIFFHLHQA
ncbi:hypothetical protein HMPREF9442_01564 [Paraprevotella xylaniphila YIT 11841]|uniref:Uncharacterized protein n=1 Tax=Paraprevotella xylaniphila YIT 11841 TaxID=762982 RepID=F3QTP5_9BACT|nr:hypothetical protein HMPREF9442_01564 [Paraprevotella xylaniphila YIT 11841]